MIDQIFFNCYPQVHRLWLKQPVISIADLEVLKQTDHRNWSTHVIDVSFPAAEGVPGFIKKLQSICEEADEAAEKHEIIVLSDRSGGQDRVPISILLALGMLTSINRIYCLI